MSKFRKSGMLTKVQGAESTGLVLATKELAAKKLRAKKDKIFEIDECVGLFILLVSVNCFA